MPRTFIAFPISEAYWQSLRDIQHQLQISGIKYRLLRSENFHVTAAFLGDLPVERIEAVTKGSAVALSGYKPFSVTTKSLTGFPTTARTRSIVVKLGGKQITKLQRQVSSIRTTLQKLEFWFDPQPFVPHITIGRVDRGRDFSKTFPLRAEPFEIELPRIGVFVSEMTTEGLMKYHTAQEYLLSNNRLH